MGTFTPSLSEKVSPTKRPVSSLDLISRSLGTGLSTGRRRPRAWEVRRNLAWKSAWARRKRGRSGDPSFSPPSHRSATTPSPRPSSASNEHADICDGDRPQYSGLDTTAYHDDHRMGDPEVRLRRSFGFSPLTYPCHRARAHLRRRSFFPSSHRVTTTCTTLTQRETSSTTREGPSSPSVGCRTWAV